MTEKATTKTTRRNVGEIIQRERVYYIRYYGLRGRRRLESTHSDDRNEAEKLLRKRLSAKDGGVLPEAAIGSLTLKEATDDLIADYETNKRKSLRDVQGKITMHLLPFFGERRKMTSIGTPEIRRFFADRQSEERDDDGKVTKPIYRRYAIVDEAMLRETAARLDAWMAGPPAAPSTATVTALHRGSRLRGRVTG